MDDSPSILPLLNNVPLFKDLNEADHKAVIANIKLMYYPAGYSIFHQGDEADALYIIKSGSVSVFSEDEGGKKLIAVLKPYQFFGEMGLFKDAPRNATVQTEEDTEVLILKKADFFALVAANDRIARALSEEYFLREHNRNYPLS